MKYDLDPNKAREGSGRGSMMINESGAYVGTITVAKEAQARTGTTGIELTFETNDGLKAPYLTLWTRNANGEPIFGEKQLHALMTCLKVESINSVERVIKQYDPDLRREVDEPANVYPELMNKPVGLILQREEYYNRNSELKARMSFFAPFEASTRKTASEILDQSDAKQVDKILSSLYDKPAQAQSSNQTAAERAASQEAGQAKGLPADNFDDDIPF